MGADRMGAASVLVPMSDGRLLAAIGDGADSLMLCLSKDEPPLPMLSGVAGIVDACVSSDGQSLYLCTGDAVSRCPIDVETGVCGAPEELPMLAGGTSALAVMVDVNDNLYVCTADGLLIGDEYGDPSRRGN